MTSHCHSHRRARAGHADSAYHDGGLLRSTVLVLALGALLTTSWRAITRNHQRRVGKRSRPLPEKLLTWEGEGGRPSDPETQATTAPPIGL